MDREYWDSLAESYEDELLEIAREADGGVLEEEIRRVASKRRVVADLGCGPGSLLPLLADCFREVLAVDYAPELLREARRRHGGGAGALSFHCHDLSGGGPFPFEAEVVCCVNALIDPRRRKREGMLRAAASVVRPGGTALVVVPALESVFHVYHSLLRIRAVDGRHTGLTEAQAERLLRSEMDSFAGGIIRVGGTPTKYWMREEILGSLADAGLQPVRVRKVEYPWAQEIEDPPEWLREPFPWDWLVVCEGRSRLQAASSG